MEERRWEELGMDCLVNIFERLGMEDKTSSVPFVCKSWCRASLNPMCWRVLNYHALLRVRSPSSPSPWDDFAERFVREHRLDRGRFSFSAFLKFTVDRSCGCAVEILFPEDGVSLEDLAYVADKCPALKVLVMPELPKSHGFAGIVGKWKDLERLYMRGNSSGLNEIVSEISLNCKNFTGIQNYGEFLCEEACRNLTTLPNLKYLCLSGALLGKKHLMVMLRGCHALEKLYLRNARCLVVDEEIAGAAAAAGVETFEYGFSTPPEKENCDDDDDEYPYVRMECGWWSEIFENLPLPMSALELQDYDDAYWDDFWDELRQELEFD